MRYIILTILLFVSYWSSGQNFYWSHNIGAPVVITHNVGSYTADEATWFWEVLRTGGDAFTESGILISTSINPVKDSTTVAMEFGKGMFSNFFTNLHPQTTYYVRAWASNQYGTVYGENIYFTTPGYPSGVPIVQTKQASEITPNSAKSGGIIIHGGGSNITQKGVILRLTPGVTWANKSDFTNNGTGTAEYTSNMTELLYDTTYYYRAYALNSSGYGYGDEFMFRTLGANVPLIVTNTTSGNIRGSVVDLFPNGTIIEDFGLPIINSGFYISQSRANLGTLYQNALIVNDSFSLTIENLSPVTTYYITAFADNGVGRGYGLPVTYSPSATNTAPLVVAYINKSSNVFGGIILDYGGLSITSRVLCITQDTTQAFGLFDCVFPEYIQGNMFYMSTSSFSTLQYFHGRAYATNSAGTGQSNWVLICNDTDVYSGREAQAYLSNNRYIFDVDPRNGFSYRITLSRFRWTSLLGGMYTSLAPISIVVYDWSNGLGDLIHASTWIGDGRYNYNGGNRVTFINQLVGKSDYANPGYQFPHSIGTAPDGYPYVHNEAAYSSGFSSSSGVSKIAVTVLSPNKNPAAFAVKTWEFQIGCKGNN